MKSTTARRFGSSGQSFTAPSAVAPTIGAALLASGTSETADTAWSPSAACLLPDILPVAGTLLSYGGSRQLAAGGTVTHSGALTLGGALTLPGNPSSALHAAPKQYVDSAVGAVDLSGRVPYTGATGAVNLGSNALTCGAITASGITLAGTYLSYPRISTAGNLVFYARDANRLRLDTSGVTAASSGSIGFNSGTNLDTGIQDAYFVRNSASSIGVKGAAGINGALTCGAITASGAIQETPTQSALDPTTTNIPSGKRQGWYNSTLAEFRDWVNIGGTLLKSAAYT